MGALAPSLGAIASRWRLRHARTVGRGARARGEIWIHGGGAVDLGDGVELDGRSAPIELHARAGAEIVIGDGARVEGGASIEATRSVRIGARAHLGRFCKILDNHFHRVGDRGAEPPSTPVVVEDDASLGARAILLPGAYVGRGAVVGAGTVVARKVPPGATMAGLPATLKRGDPGGSPP